MKGRILGFTPDSGTGTISGDNGNRYGFSRAEWRGEKPVGAGLAVDFEVCGSEAVGIYPVAGAAQIPDLEAGCFAPGDQGEGAAYRNAGLAARLASSTSPALRSITSIYAMAAST